MTLSNEINQLQQILTEYNINGVKDLRRMLQAGKRSQVGDVAHVPIPDNAGWDKFPMRTLQGKLSSLLGQLADVSCYEHFQGDIKNVRRWVEDQCQIVDYRFRSESEDFRDDCIRQIEFCRAVLNGELSPNGRQPLPGMPYCEERG